MAGMRRGSAMAEQGRNGEGLAQIEKGLADYLATGTGLGLPQCLCKFAEACVETGRLDDALSALAEALMIANEREDRVDEAEIHRLKGEALRRQNDFNAAEAQGCFERAIEVARGQSAKSWELRATISLARLLASQGPRDEARTMLADIYNWFTEGFETADLIEAKSLLVELSN